MLATLFIYLKNVMNIMPDDTELVTLAHKHLEDIMQFPKYQLTPKDKRSIAYNKAQWITDRLTAKKFRKAGLDNNILKDISTKVQMSIKENKPIYLIILFGGYKHFWNASYPEVDFAELFNLRMMCECIAPILEAHEPGVILDYESEDVIMWMDNYPESALNTYADSFKSLIKSISKNRPDNFKINYVRAREQYDAKKLFARIGELAPKRREEWSKISKEELDLKLHRSPSNIMWKGNGDWTKLNESEKQKKILESKIINETFYDADFELRGDYLCGGNHIPIVLSWGLTYENTLKWITFGSTYASTTDFWIGRGILEHVNGKFIERVISHKQYDAVKTRLKTIKVDFLPLKNFKDIEVYEDKIQFDAIIAQSRAPVL